MHGNLEMQTTTSQFFFLCHSRTNSGAPKVQVEDLEGHEVKVSAQGPAGLSFKRDQSARATHRASFYAAGMYLVHVQVSGRPLSGWPRALHVAAAASEAARSAPFGMCMEP